MLSTELVVSLVIATSKAYILQHKPYTQKKSHLTNTILASFKASLFTPHCQLSSPIPLDDDDDDSKKTPLVKRLKFGGGEKEKESRRCASATTGGGHNRRRTKGAKEVVHGS